MEFPRFSAHITSRQPHGAISSIQSNWESIPFHRLDFALVIIDLWCRSCCRLWATQAGAIEGQSLDVPFCAEGMKNVETELRASRQRLRYIGL
jgi:hypothetical protein